MALIVKNPPNDLLLSLVINKSKYDGTLTHIRAFKEVTIHKYYVPFAFGIAHRLQTRPLVSARATSTDHDPPFRSHDQQVVYDEMIQSLEATRTSILSVHVGFGKTFLAIRLIAQLNLKTLVVIPTSKKVLQEQWVREFGAFYPQLKVQLLSSASKIDADADADVYIIGTLTISKLYVQLKNLIQLVVVDELHLALSDGGYQNLLCLFPSYLLGLSATPYRVDGSDKLVELFFGRAQVTRKLYREYFVRAIITPFSFPLEKTNKGKVNWSRLLTAQAECEERNRFIASIVVTNPSLKFLILCKRVSQIKDVRQLCAEQGVDIQAVYGPLMPVRDARSLIGHVSKLGVGFSDSSFNALLLGGDVQEYFIQYFGRVLRDETARPIVFDIVDACPILKRHYAERETIYKESGGQIKEFKMA